MNGVHACDEATTNINPFYQRLLTTLALAHFSIFLMLHSFQVLPKVPGALRQSSTVAVWMNSYSTKGTFVKGPHCSTLSTSLRLSIAFPLFSSYASQITVLVMSHKLMFVGVSWGAFARLSFLLLCLFPLSGTTRCGRPPASPVAKTLGTRRPASLGLARSCFVRV